MNLPKIEINGVIHEMKKPVARGWKSVEKFEQERKNIPLIDYVDKLCEFLAPLFEGVTADDLLDNVPLEDIQKIYAECYVCYFNLLSGKFEELEKNSPSTTVNH